MVEVWVHGRVVLSPRSDYSRQTMHAMKSERAKPARSPWYASLLNQTEGGKRVYEFLLSLDRKFAPEMEATE